MKKLKKAKHNLKEKLPAEIYKGYKLKCGECGRLFGINANYIGVVTCPYCGELVEQP